MGKGNGKSKRRTWRKIHLGICGHSQEIVLSLLTEKSVSDAEGAEEMAKGMPSTVKRGYGDGAYDKSSCYKKFRGLGIDWVLLRKEERCVTTLSANRG